MADDIDELLNEVETKFVAKSGSNKRSQSLKERTGNTRPLKSQLSEAIDDIFDDGVALGPAVTHTPSASSQAAHASGSRRCVNLRLGGSSDELGLSTSVSDRCCDRLRCTDCDFMLVSYDNYEWSRKTDYLFLRNNMPDFHRLKSNLKMKQGSRAYACQCKSKNVASRMDIPPDYKWHCGKH